MTQLTARLRRLADQRLCVACHAIADAVVAATKVAVWQPPHYNRDIPQQSWFRGA